jgi:hypothetical protein
MPLPLSGFNVQPREGKFQIIVSGGRGLLDEVRGKGLLTFSQALRKAELVGPAYSTRYQGK